MPAGRDFGGSRESIDIDAEATAAREFAEETLGVFASMAVNACAVAQSSESMAQQLRARTHALEIKRPLKQVRFPPAENTCSRLFHPPQTLYIAGCSASAVAKQAPKLSVRKDVMHDCQRMIKATEHEAAGHNPAVWVQGYYSMFITMLPHLDPMMFYLATQQNAQTQAVAGAEKTAFAW